MSLLIKALASAEKDKQAELSKKQTESAASASLALELEPITQHVADQRVASAPNQTPDTASQHASASFSNAHQPSVLEKQTKQKVAASVFVANQGVKNASSMTALLLLGVAGALIIWLGLQGYQYVKNLAAPKVILTQTPPASSVAVAPEQSVAEPAMATHEVAEVSVAAPVSPPTSEADRQKTAQKTAEETLEPQIVAQVAPAKPPQEKRLKNTPAATEKSVKAADSATPQALKLSSKTPQAGVDPVLLAAYEAYTKGEDATAQQQYRQVLQADKRNIDALLGMAAIAQRQGREADAVGWYQKVLEIEPRNTFAQTAIANMQAGNHAGAQHDVVAKESQLKTLLAQQPEAAHLHAALGNVYVAQNQWPAAQQAYFNASRFAPDNADYAFNLAVSLEHLGKSDLALTHYQRALTLLNRSGAASPDKTILTQRIEALAQSF